MTNENLTPGQIADNTSQNLEYARPGQPGHEEYARQSQEIQDAFYEGLQREHGSELTSAQHKIVYSQAYSVGHSGGYSEIEYNYIELVEFTQRLIAAGA